MPVATRPATRTPATFAPIPITGESGTAACSSTAAEEGAERGGKRDRAEALERGALGALAALEDGAVLALAQVGAQGASLRAREALLLQAREGELCFLAGEAALELFAQGPAGAEDEGLNGADGDIEDLGDLGVRAALELAHDERCALVEAEEPEGAADLARARHVAVVGGGRSSALVELDLLGPPRSVAEALAADVVGDLDQPVVGALWAFAALERAVGAHEGGLGDVLRVGFVVHDGQRVAVDGVNVLLVEALEGAVDGTRSLRE